MQNGSRLHTSPARARERMLAHAASAWIYNVRVTGCTGQELAPRADYVWLTSEVEAW